MKLFNLLAAAAAITLGVSGVAQAQDQKSFAKFDGWEIFENETNCSAITSFGDGTVAWLAYSKSNDNGTLMIFDKKRFANVTNNAPFTGQLVFLNDSGVDMDWSTLALSGAVIDADLKGIMVRAPGDRFLTTFSKSNIFGVLKGEDVVVSLKPDGMAKVAQSLRSCGGKK